MNINDKTLGNIRNAVSSRPDNFEEQKSIFEGYIYECVSEVITTNELHHKLLNTLLQLPYQSIYWERKHIYLLLHELLNIASLTNDIEDILHDIETVIIGYVADPIIKGYPNEPSDHEQLVCYVRDGNWLNNK